MDFDDEYQEAIPGPKRKRPRRGSIRPPSPTQPEDPDTLALKQANSFAQSAHNFNPPSAELDSFVFDTTFPSAAEEYLRARRQVESAHATRNDHGHVVRPISRLEADQLVWELAHKQGQQTSTRAENILLRRLTQRVSRIDFSRQRAIDLWHAEQLPPRLLPVPTSNQTQIGESLPLVAETEPAPPGVLEELYAIKSTPFDQSFASRLYGHGSSPTTIFFQDWETMSPWMELMADVMAHYHISQ
ncbi:hypothetical protein FRC10_005162 [Ceratobasidium sp. 414]|nr:hypothetical protein FRC10_005162 [Ceratobasidium sp. 414]